MKITSQTIPNALAAAYAKLITAKPTVAGTSFSARTKKAVHLPAPSRKPRKPSVDIENAVDFLIAFLTEKNGVAPAASLRAEQITKLRDGIFDTDYWIMCAIESEQVLLSEPTYVPRTGPRPYAYPDPTNQPTVATYPAGNESSGALQYIGYTAGTYFRDVSLKWKRLVFKLENKFLTEKAEPVFLKISGTISASADMRASRAMLSAIFQRFFVVDGSATLTTLTPPVIKPISALYRYRTPRGSAPFYNCTNPLQLVYSLRGRKFEEIYGDLTRCVVLAAPMPMMGHRYNNNTEVASTLSATFEMWQVLKGYVWEINVMIEGVQRKFGSTISEQEAHNKANAAFPAHRTAPHFSTSQQAICWMTVYFDDGSRNHVIFTTSHVYSYDYDDRYDSVTQGPEFGTLDPDIGPSFFLNSTKTIQNTVRDDAAIIAEAKAFYGAVHAVFDVMPWDPGTHQITEPGAALVGSNW